MHVFVSGRIWRAIFEPPKEEEEEKENTTTTTTTMTTKTRRKKPRILFIGDDEYDSVGGIANEDTDMDALDVSKGLEPLQTTFRRAFFDGLKALNRKRDDDDDEQQHPTSISGAISLALTYANRIERDPSLRGRVKSRLLVVQASEDDAEQYVPMMNAMFASSIEQHFHRLFVFERERVQFLTTSGIRQWWNIREAREIKRRTGRVARRFARASVVLSPG